MVVSPLLSKVSDAAPTAVTSFWLLVVRLVELPLVLLLDQLPSWSSVQPWVRWLVETVSRPLPLFPLEESVPRWKFTRRLRPS